LIGRDACGLKPEPMPMKAGNGGNGMRAVVTLTEKSKIGKIKNQQTKEVRS